MINFFAKRPSVAKLLFGRSASARTDYCKCIQIKGFSLSRRNNCSSAVQSVTIRCVMIAGVGCSKKLHTNNFLRRLAARSALEFLNFTMILLKLYIKDRILLTKHLHKLSVHKIGWDTSLEIHTATGGDNLWTFCLKICDLGSKV